MMEYLWYDHTADANGPVLPGLAQIEHVFQASRLTGDASDLKDNALAFVHAGSDSGQTIDDWKRVITGEQNRYIVFVSSEVWSPSANKNAPGNIYYITQKLSNIAEYLSKNPEKVESFKKSCEKGNPDWKIFDPVFYPENLIAWYLADVAAQQKVKIDDTKPLEEIQKKAKAEYNNLAKAHNHKLEFNKHGVEGLFKEMAKSF